MPQTEKQAKHAAYQAIWRAKNKESVKRSQKKYREANKEKRQAYLDTWKEARKNDPEWKDANRQRSLNWRNANRIKYTLTKRAYYEKNIERITAYKNQWYLNNDVNVKLRARARQDKLQFIKINPVDICNWESRICGICDKLIEDKYDIDHILPLSRGGMHEVNNLQLAHPRCNNIKYTKTQEEIKKLIGVLI